MKKEKVVLVYGVWDILHIGHPRFLERAKKLGDKLIVGVLSDEYVAKHKRRPYIKEKQRIEMLTYWPFIDNIVLVGEGNYEKVMIKINPDLVVHGSDWKDAPSIVLAKELGIKTRIISSTKSISTTKIIDRIKDVSSR